MASSSQTTVSNEDYERAWLDETNRRIISAISRRYKGKLPYDEIVYRGQMALFKCMRKHSGERGNKFTTSLHRYVMWEFDNAVRDRIRELERTPPALCIEDFQVQAPDAILSMDVNECLMKMSEPDRIILQQSFIHGMPLREIQREAGYSHMTAKRKLQKAIDKFKYLWRKKDVRN